MVCRNNSTRAYADFPSRMLALGAELGAKAGDRWSMVRPNPGPMPTTADVGIPGAEIWGSPYDIGAARSWVPTLGEIVWEIPKQVEARAYYANVCKVADSRQVGYVRVPDYKYNRNTVQVFEEVIARFEDTTSAMVLDQINNNGGSLFQMYALLSTLTDRALTVPQHHITIDDDYAAVAADVVELAEAGEAVPPDERPSPERVAYARFVLSERAAGRGTARKVTNRTYLEGVSEILPARNHYTKRIVVLINALSFSAAEYLAAILQDNRRATLFGERTAGAGGCAKRIPFPRNEFFLAELTITWAMAWRTNGQPIENLGVHPDVAYSPTVEDLQFGYQGYRQALLAAINA